MSRQVLLGRIQAIEAQLGVQAGRVSAVTAPAATTPSVVYVSRTGNDNNSGLSAANAVQSIDAVVSKYGFRGVLQPTTAMQINVLDDYAGAETSIAISPQSAAAQISVVGTPIVLAQSGVGGVGVVTAFVNKSNLAGNIPAQITVPGVTWGNYTNGCFVKILTGPAAGAWAPVEKDLGANTARMGNWIIPNPQATTPSAWLQLAGGESIQIVRPPNVPFASIEEISGYRSRGAATPSAYFQSIHVASPAAGQDVDIDADGLLRYVTCTFDRMAINSEAGVDFQVAAVTPNGFVFAESGANVSFFGGALLDSAAVQVNDGCFVALSRDCTLQNAFVNLSPSAVIQLLEVLAFDNVNPFFALSQAMILLNTGGHYLGGSNNGTTIALGAASTLVLGDTAQITATATANDFTLDGRNSIPWYQRSDTGAVVAGPLACTWGNVAAPVMFVDPASGARIVRSTTV